MSEEERLWRVMMNSRYNIAETKKNAKIVGKLRKAGKLRNGELPRGMITEQQAFRRGWDAYEKWITLHERQ